jgi:tetratricopeptide (TPR) repeat protein
VFFQKRSQLGEELYRANPNSESLKNGLSVSYSKLGSLYQKLNQLDSAAFYFAKDLQLTEELYQANPKNVELWGNLGISYYTLGALSVELDSTKQAISYYERAAKIFKDLYAFTGLNSYLDNYNTVQRRIKKLQEPANPLLQKIQTLEKQVEKATAPADKVKYQQELVELLQGLVDAAPDNTDIKNYAADAYGSLAWYALFTRQFSAAEQAARTGITLGGEPAAWIHTNLALALLYQSKYAAAEAFYKQFKGKPYDDERGWTEVFLADLDELEKAGITHPDVAKVRKLLRE